jgi:hypothetical protein
MIKDFVAMLNFFEKMGSDISPDPNIYYRTISQPHPLKKVALPLF